MTFSERFSKYCLLLIAGVIPLSAQVGAPMPDTIPSVKQWIKNGSDTLDFSVKTISVASDNAESMKSLTDLLENDFTAKTIAKPADQNNLDLKIDTQDQNLQATGAYKLVIDSNVSIVAKD